MNSTDKEYILEKLNEVIRTNQSTLSNEDIERLVTVREKIKHSKSKKGILIILGTLAKLFLDD